MALERSISDAEIHFHIFGDAPFKQKWSGSDNQVSDSSGGSFECNICLESAYEPVVTLCGHLYCWPCIYRWLVAEASSKTEQMERNCPVCKANISASSLVPLYGRGSASKSTEGKPFSDKAIPERPSPNGPITASSSGIPTSYPSTQLHTNVYHSRQQPFYDQQFLPPNYGGFGTYTAANANDATIGHNFDHSIRLLGEMVFARMFGRSDTSFFSYTHSNFYTRRMRRQEMQLDQSLNRVSIFLFCCLILCLVLF